MAKKPRRLELELFLPHPPFWMIAAALIFVLLTWLPLVFIARSRVTPSPAGEVKLALDMYIQPKVTAQAPSPVFVDGRGMRQPVPGTVARGGAQLDDHYYRGYKLEKGDDGKVSTTYYQGMPKQVRVDEKLLITGQQQFDVYCFPCHGKDGAGDGPVTRRATQLAGDPNNHTVWARPANLHELTPEGKLKFGRELYPDGELFNTITNGKNNMGAYGPQISVPHRWAIVAYVRALQLSQHASPALLTPEQRKQLSSK